MKLAFRIGYALSAVGLIVGISHGLILMERRGTPVAASTNATLAPLNAIPASAAVARDVAAQELFQQKVTEWFKNSGFQREIDELQGMTNRVQQEINSDMAALKLSPNDYEFRQDCRCYVPKPKPVADEKGKPQ